VNDDLLQSLAANRRASDQVSDLQDYLLQSMAARQRCQGVLSSPFASLDARADLLPPGSTLALARNRLTALQNSLLRDSHWNSRESTFYESLLNRTHNDPPAGPEASKRGTSSPPVGHERKQA